MEIISIAKKKLFFDKIFILFISIWTLINLTYFYSFNIFLQRKIHTILYNFLILTSFLTLRNSTPSVRKKPPFFVILGVFQSPYA